MSQRLATGLRKSYRGPGASSVGPSTLNVEDDDAFDIDERVTMTLTNAIGSTIPIVVGWGRERRRRCRRYRRACLTDELASGLGGASIRSTTLTLDRARSAQCGVQGTQVAEGAREGIALWDVSACAADARRKVLGVHHIGDSCRAPGLLPIAVPCSVERALGA